MYTTVFVGAMKNVNSDVAYDYIRKRILNGEFEPGQQLMTEDLSDEIGVSRTPVRDALRQLEADGLVVIRPRLGASVKTMELKEFREMCGLRLALEGYAAGLAAQHRAPADLDEMRLALDRMRSLTERIVAAECEQPCLADLARADVRFHIAVITAAKNDLMKKEILRLHLINRVVVGARMGELMPQLSRAESTSRRKAVLAEHDAIYRAIEASDVRVAKDAMEHHIQDIIDNSILLIGRVANLAMARELTDEELAYSA
jgi:DNA-binding GntR family transcriptional regulator